MLVFKRNDLENEKACSKFRNSLMGVNVFVLIISILLDRFRQYSVFEICTHRSSEIMSSIGTVNENRHLGQGPWRTVTPNSVIRLGTENVNLMEIGAKQRAIWARPIFCTFLWFYKMCCGWHRLFFMTAWLVRPRSHKKLLLDSSCLSTWKNMASAGLLYWKCIFESFIKL